MADLCNFIDCHARNERKSSNLVVETGWNERFEARRKFETAEMDDLSSNENYKRLKWMI